MLENGIHIESNAALDISKLLFEILSPSNVSPLAPALARLA